MGHPSEQCDFYSSNIAVKFTDPFGQNGFAGTNIDLAVFKNRMVNRMANFMNLVFLITLPKKKRSP